MSENNVNNALLIAPYLKLHKAITTYEGPPNHW